MMTPSGSAMDEKRARLAQLLAPLRQADAWARSGEWDSCVRAARQFKATWRRRRLLDHVYANILLGRAYLAQDDLPAARTVLLESQRDMAGDERGSVPPGHAYRIATSTTLGDVFLRQGKVDKAVTCLQNACRDAVVAGDEVAMARTYLRLGRVQMDDAGRIEDAVQSFEYVCSLAICIDADADAWNSLGNARLQLGDVGAAREAFDHARHVLEAEGDIDNPDLATLYVNLGMCHKALVNGAEAVAYFHKGRILRERVLGANHEDTATTYVNLASLYLDQGDVQRAVEYGTRALQVRRAIQGEETLAVAECMSLLGAVHLHRRDFQSALLFSQQAYLCRQKLLGEAHEATTRARLSVADVYTHEGRSDEALAIYTQELDRATRRHGKMHETTAALFNGVANILRQQDRKAQALEMYKDALAVYEHVYGPEHATVATLCNNIGHLSQPRTALQLYVRARAIRERALGPAHPDTAACWMNLGHAYLAQRPPQTHLAQQHFERAKQLYLDAADGDADQADVVAAQRQLVMLKRRASSRRK